MASEAPLASIRWRPFRLPLRHRFQAAHGALADRTGVLVQLVDADGVTGTGEASPLPSFGGGTVDDVLALLDGHAAALATASTGRDASSGFPLSIDSAEESVLGGRRPSGGALSALRCALDVARLDLEARRVGLPVARLLAASPVREVEVNAVMGDGTPAETAAAGIEATAAGYHVLKLKVGVAGLEADLARAEALRGACPAAAIRLDANGAWDEAAAREAIHRLAPLDIELLEQPVPPGDVAAFARLHGEGIRLAVDEALSVAASTGSVRAIFEHRAGDFLVLKPMMLGGLRPALGLARQAAGAGMRCFVTTTFDSSIGIAAALHLATALPLSGPAHGLSTGEHLAADVVARTIVPEDGMLGLPDAAGLGVEVDAAALDAVATGPWVERRL